MKVLKRIIPLFVAVLMVFSLAACGGAEEDAEANAGAGTETTAFPKFQGTDFEGNEVDESLFGKNKVTLVNFWFNGCSACVEEMPNLEAFNKQLKEKGAELIGINVEAGGDKAALAEAKKILAKQGATYRNIALQDGEEMNKYINNLYGFPTTVLVDGKGNIVGEPILGSIDESRMADIMKMVEDVAAGKAISSSDASAKGKDVSSLLAEENSIYDSHMDLWGRVMDSIPKDKAMQAAPEEYVNLLKEQIESNKDSFTEEELQILQEDMAKIEEIEQKIQELEQAE